MDLESLFPFESKKSIRGLILSILVNESPLKVFEIASFIRKRYGRDISFQAVSKEVLYLIREGVLVKKDRDISINKEWVRKVKNNFDEINDKIVLGKKINKKDLSKEISNIEFHSLKDAMDYWYKIIDAWFANFKKGDYNLNCYQTSHIWEALLHLDQEVKIMSKLKAKGIRSYAIMGDTKLDEGIFNLYSRLKIKAKMLKAKSDFDKSYVVATYGDIIIQLKLPDVVVVKIDSFFRKNDSIDSYDLSELLSIVKSQQKISMTVIKNLEMAKQMNKSIMMYFK
jgi:acyl carrier protein